MARKNEQYLIDKFRLAYPAFPEGQLIHGNSPDFILITEKMSHRIGIEHTAIFQDSHLGSSKLLQRSEMQWKITDKVISLLNNMLPWKFIMDLEIDFEIVIEMKKFNATCQDISDAIVTEFKGLNNEEGYRLFNIDIDLRSSEYSSVKELIEMEGYRSFPQIMKSVRMFRWDSSDHSYDTHGEGGSGSSLQTEHVDFILQAKKAKMLNYKPCDEYWLIIEEGLGYAGYFTHIEVPVPVTTTFDKVFIYRHGRDEVVVLK